MFVNIPSPLLLNIVIETKDFLNFLSTGRQFFPGASRKNKMESALKIPKSNECFAFRNLFFFSLEIIEIFTFIFVFRKESNKSRWFKYLRNVIRMSAKKEAWQRPFATWQHTTAGTECVWSLADPPKKNSKRPGRHQDESANEMPQRMSDKQRKWNT